MKMHKRIITISMMIILSVMTIIPVFAAREEVIVKDLPKDAWYTEAMTDLVEKSIIKGHKGKVNPTNKISRAEYAQILLNTLELDGIIGFDNVEDVKPSDWFYDAMVATTAHGILKGDGGNKLRPYDYLTREEVFVLTARAFEIGSLSNMENIDEDVTHIYKDGDSVSRWAKSGTSALINAGIINGNEEGKLVPKDYITRAEIASILQKIKFVQDMDKIVTIVNK